MTNCSLESRYAEAAELTENALRGGSARRTACAVPRKPAKPLDLPSLRRPPNKRRKLPENSECRQLAEVMPSGKLLKIARSPEPTLTLID